jgi:hypothetical protein
MFRDRNIVSLVKPHEMFWSAEDFVKRGEKFSDMADERLMKIVKERG